MTNEFERDIRARLHSEAEEVEMSGAQHQRIMAAAAADNPRGRWLRDGAPVFVFGATATLLLLAVVTHIPQVGPRNPSAVGPGKTPSAQASPASSATAGASPAPSPSTEPLQCDAASGSIPGVANQVITVRVAQRGSFDRLVFEFGGPGTPSGAVAYSLGPQHSTTFTQDASGLPVQVGGAKGAQLTLRNATDVAPQPERDQKPGYPALVEVRDVGNFEAVNTWAIGLNGTGCYQLHVLTAPTRLVLDWQVP